MYVSSAALVSLHVGSNFSFIFLFASLWLVRPLEPIDRSVDQLQIGERNWSREKLELLERFSQERAQWEQRLREATTHQEKVRRAEPLEVIFGH